MTCSISLAILPHSLLDSSGITPMFPHDAQRLLQAGSAGALADAAAHLRRCLRTDGAADGEDDEFSAPERQWAALIDWASTCGKILPLDFPAPEREGGREHDVTLDELSGRWIKYTKRSSSGSTVSWNDHGEPYMHNATPSEYLRRLLWQNEVFGDDIHLVGLWQEQTHQWRIVTSQPGLQGTRATMDDVLISPDGHPLPIDVLITRSPMS